MIKPIPLAALGPIYSTWHDAPAGALLAFGGRRMVGEGNNWHPWDDPIVALRADDNGLGPCMVSILPEVHLIVQPPAQGQWRMFQSCVAYSIPAADIRGQYELAIADLAPKQAPAEFDAGQVIRTSDGALLAFAGITSHERFVVVSGEQQWRLVGRPHGDYHAFGKLVICEKRVAV
ncbi:MAG TPA: hypothetical protein VFI23_11470 [Rhizomicrobium sp.]|nr:hypothetical protein [Rhizomicrobium sp.]